MNTGRNWPEAYEPISMLSRANTCEVWDCWDRNRACRVVVKTLREDRLGDTRSARELIQEGELLLSLEHPHILRAYETASEPVPFVVMETISGETLSHTIDEGEDLTAEEIAHLGLQLVSALVYLHRSGHAHLDLKSSNIIGESGRARLIDLGLAQPFGDSKPGTGTWCYMAPEQVTGIGMGPATDVWGLGAVFYECICGHPPFDDPDIEGEHPETVTGSDEGWDGEYPQLSRDARISGSAVTRHPALERLALACLSKEPADRPSLESVAAALEDILGLESERRRVSRSIR